MRSPLLLLAACFALGITLASRGPLPSLGSPTFLIAACSCLLCGVVALRLGWQRGAGLLVLAGFAAAGGASACLFEARFPPHHVSHLTEFGVDVDDPVRLEGRLITTPLRTAYGWQFDVQATRVESRGMAHVVTGKVRLRLRTPSDEEEFAVAESLDLRYGDTIRTLARLHKPRVYRNPGSFDFRRWMENIEDITWVGTINYPRLVEKLASNERPKLGSFLHRVRQALLHGIDRLYPPWSAEGRYGAVLKAMLLGDRSSLNSQIVENFRRTGLYHLLVISGLHVGLLALMVGAVLRRLPLGEYWRAALVMAFLLAYVWLIEVRAPTLRATLMIFAYLVARFFYREQAALNAIGLAALVLLAYRPPWLFESGFQLSFAAALLIAGLAVPVLGRTTEPYRRALGQLENAELDVYLSPRIAQFRVDLRGLVSAVQKRLSPLRGHRAVAEAVVTAPVALTLWIANVVLFSAIIQIGMMLPMAETFHRVTFVGIGLNALAAPLMMALLGVALPTILLAAALPVVAVWPAKLLGMITGGLLALTDFPQLPSWLTYRVPEPTWWVSWGFALSAVAAAWTFGRHRRSFLASVSALGIFLGLISLHPFAPRLPRGVLEATTLDCGGGDALFLVLPDQRTMLVDGGGGRARAGGEGAFRAGRWNPGEDVVSPYLWGRGVKSIDIVVLTVPRGDQVAGLRAVISNFHVGEFWHAATRPTRSFQELFEKLWERGIPVRRLGAGDVIQLGETTAQILWPPPEPASDAALFGDKSVVMRISADGASLLVPGDISWRVEQQLVEAGAELSSQVLRVANSGSKSSSSRVFLERISPWVAVVSAGGGSRFNLPDDETLERLRLVGARVFRTDLDGAVTVRMKVSTRAVRTQRDVSPR